MDIGTEGRANSIGVSVNGCSDSGSGSAWVWRISSSPSPLAIWLNTSLSSLLSLCMAVQGAVTQSGPMLSVLILSESFLSELMFSTVGSMV